MSTSNGGSGRLKERVALFTGAGRTRGMGYAIAKQFAREGAGVTLKASHFKAWNAGGDCPACLVLVYGGIELHHRLGDRD
jgi:hypothetical protein